MFIFFNSLFFGSSGIEVQRYYSKYMIRLSAKKETLRENEQVDRHRPVHQRLVLP